MRFLVCLVTGLTLVAACGQAFTTAGGGDGGIDGAHDGGGGGAGAAGQGGSGGSAGSEGSVGSGGSAGSGGSTGSGGSAGTGGHGGSGGSGGFTDSGLPPPLGDAAALCMPPGAPCTIPCPAGTYCLKTTGEVLSKDLGCTPIPPACGGGKPTCACMGSCFCTGAMETCTAGLSSLDCNNGSVSRREFKRDISYVTADERAELASLALSTSLATYRYKNDPDAPKKHLGFIIDDQPASSPAVASDDTHVDQYGYTSMLLAAVQEQQRQIEALKKDVAELRACPGR